MKKRCVSWLILIMLFAAVLSGCNSDSSSGKENLKGATITHMVQSATNRPEAYKEMAKEFKKETGINVKIVEAPWEQMHDKIINDLVTSTGTYDVMDIDSGWDGEMARYFQPLDPYIKKYKVNMDNYLDIYKNTTGISTLTGNKRYGIPLTGQTMAMYYRKDLFEKYKLDVPKTWNDFDNALETLKQEKGVYPFVTAGVNVQLPKLFFARYIPQGKPLFTKDFKPQFNNQDGAAAIDGMKTMFKYAPPGYLSMDTPDADPVFLNGEAAIILAWPNTLSPLLQNTKSSKIKDKWDAVAPPGPGNLGPWYLSISKFSKNKEASFKWIQYLSERENSKELMVKYGNYSTLKSVWDDPAVKEAIPGAEGILKAIKNCFLPTYLMHPAGNEWFVKTGSALSDALSDKTSTQETLDKMEKNWNSDKKKNPQGLIYEELGAN